MNLQQLRYLVSAADSGSLSGAARANRVSQPVVSRALHDLEREYRVLLFRRSGRCLVLTDAGHAVVGSARRALDAVEDVERTARRVGFGPELVVVATPTNGALLSPIITLFVKHRPRTALHLRRASSKDDVLRMVASGEAELGFGDLPDQRGRGALGTEPIWWAEVVIVSPPHSKLPPAVALQDLSRSALILPPEGSDRRQAIEGIIRSSGGNPPPPALATDERSAWIVSAQRGIGSFFSYRAVAAEMDGVELRPFEPPVRAVTGFVYRAKALSDEAREMLRLANECPVPTGCHAIQSTPFSCSGSEP